MREVEQSQRAAEAKERELAAKREVSADQYSRIVDVENANRQEDAGAHQCVGSHRASACVCGRRTEGRLVGGGVVWFGCTHVQQWQQSTGRPAGYMLTACSDALCCVLCAVGAVCCVTVDARSMEQAIDALQSLAVRSESPAVDKHPEK